MKKLYLKLKKKLWIEQWNVGVLKATPKEVVLGSLDLSKTQWLLDERKDGFYADPFFLSTGERKFIFFEEFDGKNNVGKISKVEILRNSKELNVSNVESSLERPFHMSFPFFINENGISYMIPETAQANEVALYEAVDNSGQWKKKKTIISNFPALDSIIFCHEGRRWLFCTSAKDGGNSHLYAFFADELLGDWKPHEKNPIKIDLESSRPAGPVFCFNGELYRPAQNCKGTYGKEIVINKIKQLSPSKFQEEKVNSVSAKNAKKYTKGIHTISFFDEYVLIDAKRYAGVKRYLYPIASGIKKVISKK